MSKFFFSCRAGYFVGLWLAGVASVGIVGLIIRAMLTLSLGWVVLERRVH